MIKSALKMSMPNWKKGIGKDAIERLQPLLALSGTNDEKLTALSTLLASSEIGRKGIEELRYVVEHVCCCDFHSTVEVDVSLARGLNYYTGTIIEVKANDVEIGSITGGGRYDNLTGVFGMDGVSGVGISFGADRIYDVLNQLNLYPADTQTGVTVLFVNFGEKEAQASLKCILRLRNAGISCELYPDSSKMKKQMGYANDNGIPYVAIIGETELANGTIMLKRHGKWDATRIVDRTAYRKIQIIFQETNYGGMTMHFRRNRFMYKYLSVYLFVFDDFITGSVDVVERQIGFALFCLPFCYFVAIVLHAGGKSINAFLSLCGFLRIAPYFHIFSMYLLNLPYSSSIFFTAASSMRSSTTTPVMRST